MLNKAIFLDRDGVINKEVNYLNNIDYCEFIDGIFESCQYLLKLEYKIIIVTNQSGISRGYFSLEDYEKLTMWMLSQFRDQGVSILDTLFCPHLPEENCDCRKPKPGLFFAAQKKHNIDLRSSWMIGDKETDIMAGSLAGIQNTILVRSGHKIDESSSKAKFIINSIDDIKDMITS